MSEVLVCVLVFRILCSEIPHDLGHNPLALRLISEYNHWSGIYSALLILTHLLARPHRRGTILMVLVLDISAKSPSSVWRWTQARNSA